MAANETAPPIIVCDAGPLIHLDEIGCMQLLADFPQVLVPLAVWDEVAKHRPNALTHSNVRFHKATPTKALSTELDALSRLLGLHRGEQEALQVAQTQPGCLVLTDDTAARLAARNLGLATHGTIGVLLRAIRRKQKTKDEVVGLLRSLPTASTLHVRTTLLKKSFEKWNNSNSPHAGAWRI
ncbi:MAG: DNA-binding protein [Candidatus Binatia bacterium]